MTDDHTPEPFEQPADDAAGRIQTFSYDGSGPQSVGLAVVQAVASVAECDALSLQPRLYDVIDPDALERLVSDGTVDSLVEVSFEFGQYLVTVANDSTLRVQSLSVEK